MHCNQKEDARFLTLERLHERRKQVVRWHQKGHGVMHIVELSGLSYLTVRNVIDRYEAGGVNAIKPAARGKRVGQGRQLNAEQEGAIRYVICNQRPEQLDMEFALWSRTAVIQFIEREFGLQLSLRSAGNYLARWGFTQQKPMAKACERGRDAVHTWLDTEYRQIESRARARGTEIHWGGECTLPSLDPRLRIGSPQALSMITTVNNQGKTRWMIVDDALNVERQIEFLEALIKDAGRKVFLILNHLAAHQSHPFKAWVAQHAEQMEIFHLPAHNQPPQYTQ